MAAIGADKDREVGVYLTDGESLFCIVDVLPQEPNLRLIEDCSTLEILIVHIDGLRAPDIRRVQPDTDEWRPVDDAIRRQGKAASYCE